MKKLFALLAVTMTVSISGNVMAHGDKPKHGGIVQSASDLNFELVKTANTATIYVEDHGKKLSTVGATGKLTLLKGGEKSEVPLEPSGENTMISKGEVKLEKGTKAIASITFANKKNVNVRFALK